MYAKSMDLNSNIKKFRLNMPTNKIESQSICYARTSEEVEKSRWQIVFNYFYIRDESYDMEI